MQAENTLSVRTPSICGLESRESLIEGPASYLQQTLSFTYRASPSSWK